MIPMTKHFRLFKDAQDFAMGLAEKELAAEVFGLDGMAGENDVLFIKTWLDERAEGGGLLELMEELENRLLEKVSQI